MRNFYLLYIVLKKERKIKLGQLKKLSLILPSNVALNEFMSKSLQIQLNKIE